jgi:hypothetical protein
MPYCGNCGTKVEEGDLFCPNCGGPIEPDEESTPTESSPATAAAPQAPIDEPTTVLPTIVLPNASAKAHHHGRLIALIVIIAVVLIAAAAVVVFVWHPWSAQPQSTPTPAPAQQTTTPTPAPAATVPQVGTAVSNGQYVFWTSSREVASDDIDGNIYRSNLDGSALTEICQAETCSKLILDGNYLYFIQWGGNAQGDYNYIERCDLNGGSVQKLTSLSDGNVEAEELQIANSKVYYVVDDAIYAMNEDGSQKAELYDNSSESDDISSLCIAQDRIYFIADDDDSSTICSIDLSGQDDSLDTYDKTTSTDILSFQVVGSSLYYCAENHAYSDSDEYSDYAIYSRAISATGGSTLLLQGCAGGQFQVAQDGYLYYERYEPNISGENYQSAVGSADGNILCRLNSATQSKSQTIISDNMKDFAVIGSSIYYSLEIWGSDTTTAQLRMINTDGSNKVSLQIAGSTPDQGQMGSTTTAQPYNGHTYVLYFESWSEYCNQVTDWLDQHPEVSAYVTLTLASQNTAVQEIPCLYVDGAQFGTGALTVVQKLQDDFNSVLKAPTSSDFSMGTITDGQDSVNAQAQAPGANVAHTDLAPDSATRKLATSDLSHLTDAEMEIAINEIYARHGYKFTKIKQLNDIFYGADGYYGGRYTQAAHFKSSDLSKVESTNALTMRKILRSRGYTTTKDDAQLVQEFIDTYQ